MSGTELLVIGFGLFIGYWVVSKLMADKPKAGNPPQQSGNPPLAGSAWHDVLGVAPEASVEDIRAAYAKLMSDYHQYKDKSENITRAYREAMQLRGAEP